jgi:uncharacterized protein (UPF0262 family)
MAIDAPAWDDAAPRFAIKQVLRAISPGPMTEQDDNHRLQSVEIDDASLAAASRDQEQERQIAIFDLLESNRFAPQGSDGGPYDLKMGLAENRLVLDVKGPGYERRHMLSLSPFRALIKDYFMICESYYQAIRSSTPQQIETLDMGRRALHNEASEVLRTRLSGKVETDMDTARRLFTLICALHWRG